MPEIPNTIGCGITKAVKLLEGNRVNIVETSTPFEDKIQERRENKAVVVRQTIKDDCITLTVTKFK